MTAHRLTAKCTNIMTQWHKGTKRMNAFYLMYSRCLGQHNTSVTIVLSELYAKRQHVKKFVAFWRRHNVDQHLSGQLQSETHRPWRHVQRHGDATTTSSGLLTDKVALLVDTPSASMLVVTSRLNSYIILWVWRSF